jgi:hypothetical protein
MQYVSATPIAGPPEAAIKIVRDALVANAFTIVSASPTAFEATGPGLISSNQNSLMGISKASVRAEQGVLQVQAELGGAARLGLFVMVFPFVLGGVLILTLHLANRPNGLLAPVLAVSPWVVLGPLMARLFRRRTEKAINALVLSAASISEMG